MADASSTIVTIATYEKTWSRTGKEFEVGLSDRSSVNDGTAGLIDQTLLRPTIFKISAIIRM